MNLPPYIDPDTWAEFAERRRQKKVPMTESGAKRLIAKLEAFHKDGWDANFLLAEAADAGWRSVFMVPDCPRIRPIRAETPHQEKPEVVDPIKHAAVMERVRALGSKMTKPTMQ